MWLGNKQIHAFESLLETQSFSFQNSPVHTLIDPVYKRELKKPFKCDVPGVLNSLFNYILLTGLGTQY